MEDVEGFALLDEDDEELYEELDAKEEEEMRAQQQAGEPLFVVRHEGTRKRARSRSPSPGPSPWSLPPLPPLPASSAPVPSPPTTASQFWSVFAQQSLAGPLAALSYAAPVLARQTPFPKTVGEKRAAKRRGGTVDELRGALGEPRYAELIRKIIGGISELGFTAEAARLASLAAATLSFESVSAKRLLAGAAWAEMTDPEPAVALLRPLLVAGKRKDSAAKPGSDESRAPWNRWSALARPLPAK
jgi:hypothetical protein